jgi:hypothetical protein
MPDHKPSQVPPPVNSAPASAPARRDLAIWAIVAGLAGLMFYFVALAGVPAIVIGSKAWNRLERSDGYRWVAAGGIALGVIATLAWLGGVMATEA